jgi:hypothetical protein
VAKPGANEGCQLADIEFAGVECFDRLRVEWIKPEIVQREEPVLERTGLPCDGDLSSKRNSWSGHKPYVAATWVTEEIARSLIANFSSLPFAPMRRNFITFAVNASVAPECHVTLNESVVLAVLPRVNR